MSILAKIFLMNLQLFRWNGHTILETRSKVLWKSLTRRVEVVITSRRDNSILIAMVFRGRSPTSLRECDVQGSTNVLSCSATSFLSWSQDWDPHTELIPFKAVTAAPLSPYRFTTFQWLYKPACTKKKLLSWCLQSAAGRRKHFVAGQVCEHS